ncbi:hypothetical protein [Nguyenibacter vanlangensis]|uniref:Porin n=1 Tax=Nguyenibacter vanlangensis TaxID=1216886 RepID=A0A7Y7M3J5_9PROT|nr:hypothetical protein [Nguyenibacter vanlangensis]NVN09775.1 hypothetical protein [Nguyenibacter vanlangensis]
MIIGTRVIFVALPTALLPITASAATIGKGKTVPAAHHARATGNATAAGKAPGPTRGLAGAGPGAASRDEANLIPAVGLSVPGGAIPEASGPEAPVHHVVAHRYARPEDRWALTEETIVNTPRGGTPVPVARGIPWLNWVNLDIRQNVRLAKSITLHGGFGFNLFSDQAPSMTPYRDFRFDTREAYVTVGAGDHFFVDIGRFNLKAGVASGFNPTDFFRTATVLNVDTNDVTALRERRLGTFMAHAELFTPTIDVAAAIAPRLTRSHDEHYLAVDENFDLGLERTNPDWREELRLTFPGVTRFAPAAYVYHDRHAVKFGASSAVLLSSKATGYAEWAGWNRGTIVSDALTNALAAGLLPSFTPDPDIGGGGERFRQQLAIGITYALLPKVSLSLEYDYSEAGLTKGKMQLLTSAGQAGGLGAATYWVVRQYGVDQQDPLGRHTGFVRFAWSDAFVRNLSLSAIAQINLGDGSGAYQASVTYSFHGGWAVNLQGNLTAGSTRGEYGSVPQSGAVLTRIVKYF